MIADHDQVILCQDVGEIEERAEARGGPDAAHATDVRRGEVEGPPRYEPPTQPMNAGTAHLDLRDRSSRVPRGKSPRQRQPPQSSRAESARDSVGIGALERPDHVSLTNCVHAVVRRVSGTRRWALAVRGRVVHEVA
ncbi:hypothetical protein Y09_3140 [Brachybacterium sp. SW0106-09]|nr:hypothetical protein Y09_3140 [Brachybacterium sp. SW0106-09]